MSAQLYIEGQLIEQFEDENIQMTSSVQNIRDISKVFTDFTQSFTVPASPTNQLIFKHWDKVEIDGFDARTRKTATIELNFQPFKTGKIQLNKVQKKNGVPLNYQLTFFGDVVQITDDFGEDKLTDLDLSAHEHDFDSDNVRDSSFVVGTTLLSKDVIYMLASYDRVWTMGDASVTDIRFSTKIAGSGIKWNELKPAIRLQSILNAIQVKYGLQFSDHIFNTTDFLKLYMLASKEKGKMTAYGVPIELSFTGTGAYVGDDRTVLSLEDSFTAGKLICAITPSGGFEEVGYSITKVVDGVETTTSHTGDGASAEFYQGGDGDRQVVFHLSSSEAFTFTADVNMVDGAVPKYEGTVSTSASGRVYFTDTVVSGITQLGQLPDMKVVDFFKGIVNAFNLVVVPDGNRFIVQTLDDWMGVGEVKDFSEYADLEVENINRTNIYKLIDFKYQEPETVIQEAFENTNDRFYGDLEYESEVDGGTFKIELPFENLAGSLLTDDDDTLTNVRTYTVLDSDLEPIKTKPLIFYNANQETPTDPLCFLDDTDTQIEVFKYRNLGQENELTENLITHSLNWGEEVSTNTLGVISNSLFNDYWTNYITDIFSKNRRMFRFSAILPSGVLANLKLNDKIIVNNRRYIINQFTSNLLSGKVEFELLNDVRALPVTDDTKDYSLQHDLQTELHG